MSPARTGSELDQACDHLYRRHQPSLVSFACLRGCDEHEARDVVQDLFLRVFQLGMILPLSSRTEDMQRSWLLRTLRWIICNHYRHRTRLRRGGGLTTESLEHLMEEGIDFPGTNTPSGDYDRRWATSVVERCYARLRQSTKQNAWHALESSLHGADSRTTPAMRVAAHRTRVRLRQLIRLEACEKSLLQAVTACN